VARYAHRLATAFNLFYERIPVLREPNKEVVIARLTLVKAFTITLKNALGILGIKAIERM
jgi:arginyl-tRNA synthetase